MDRFLTGAEQRANAYKFFSECYHLPDDELLELLNEPPANIDLSVDVLADAAPGDLEELRVDYARLFVGPFEVLAPPYGSVYLEDQDRVMTQSTEDVMDEYLREGLDVGMKEPADHVAAELEFLYVLVVRELEVVADDDFERAATSLRKQKRFLDYHLGAWIEEFTDAVETNAKTDFYRELARQTRTFVTEDAESVSDRVNQLDIEGVESAYSDWSIDV